MVSLVDVIETNGTLQFVEGGHKLFRHQEGPNVAGYFRDSKEKLFRSYLKASRMSAARR